MLCNVNSVLEFMLIKTSKISLIQLIILLINIEKRYEQIAPTNNKYILLIIIESLSAKLDRYAKE